MNILVKEKISRIVILLFLTIVLLISCVWFILEISYEPAIAALLSFGALVSYIAKIRRNESGAEHINDPTSPINFLVAQAIDLSKPKYVLDREKISKYISLSQGKSQINYLVDFFINTIKNEKNSLDKDNPIVSCLKGLIANPIWNEYARTSLINLFVTTIDYSLRIDIGSLIVLVTEPQLTPQSVQDLHKQIYSNNDEEVIFASLHLMNRYYLDQENRLTEDIKIQLLKNINSNSESIRFASSWALAWAKEKCYWDLNENEIKLLVHTLRSSLCDENTKRHVISILIDPSPLMRLALAWAREIDQADIEAISKDSILPYSKVYKDRSFISDSLNYLLTSPNRRLRYKSATALAELEYWSDEIIDNVAEILMDQSCTIEMRMKCIVLSGVNGNDRLIDLIYALIEDENLGIFSLITLYANGYVSSSLHAEIIGNVKLGKEVKSHLNTYFLNKKRNTNSTYCQNTILLRCGHFLLLRGDQGDDGKVWMYVFMTQEGYSKFFHENVSPDTELNLNKYGVVMYSGFGDKPPLGVTNDIEHKYQDVSWLC